MHTGGGQMCMKIKALEWPLLRYNYNLMRQKARATPPIYDRRHLLLVSVSLYLQCEM